MISIASLEVRILLFSNLTDFQIQHIQKILKIQEIQNKWGELQDVSLSHTWVSILQVFFFFVFFHQSKAVIVIRRIKTPKKESFQQHLFPQIFSSSSFLKERWIVILSVTEKKRTSKEEDYNINSWIFVKTVDFLRIHAAKVLPHCILLLFCPSPATSILNSVS